MRILSALVLLVVCFASCSDSKPHKEASSTTYKTQDRSYKDPNFVAQDFTVGFYNVENLFDTINHPDKKDDEFTPGSEKDWNSERYQTKLDHLAKVISSFEGGAPEVLGVCEVENRKVLKALARHELLADAKYSVVHYESPDLRGIDVGLLFNSDVFAVAFSHAEHVVLEDPERPQTRDILYVKGILHKRDTVHLFFNHWPSRYGGAEASEPKRMLAASKVRHQVDSILAVEPDAKIIVTGDLNDYPTNKSVTEVLKAGAADAVDTDALINVSLAMHLDSQGTYNYRGEWGVLDQMIVSQALYNAAEGIQLQEKQARILKEDFMLYHDKKYDDIKPSRTYGGPNYYGGYSDHLPTYLKLKVD